MFIFLITAAGRSPLCSTYWTSRLGAIAECKSSVVAFSLQECYTNETTSERTKQFQALTWGSAVIHSSGQSSQQAVTSRLSGL